MRYFVQEMKGEILDVETRHIVNSGIKRDPNFFNKKFKS